MTVREFEEKVWQQDQVRVVVRAPAEQQVTDYNYNNAAQSNWRVTEFIQKRIRTHTGDLEVFVLQGNGKELNGNTKLNTVRGSYRR